MVEWWAWAGVLAGILGLLALDLLVFHRHAHEVNKREAGVATMVWIALGVSFAGLVWASMGSGAAGQYLSGYLLEKSLSIDNIFVIALLLRYFAVPPGYQYRVLFWGVVGALGLRAILIVAGAALLDAFHWAIYALGAFLVLTGMKMARHSDNEIDPDRNPVLRLLRRTTPITPGYHGQRFVVRDAGRRMVTPLLVVLVVVESTDLLFALDSIPAIFAVTTNRFLVFTSNAFAILGLRALYFLLAGVIGRFVYLRVGLAVVLVLVGLKSLLADVYDLPIWVSLTAIAVIIGCSIVASLRSPPPPKPMSPSETLTVSRGRSGT